MFGCINSAAVVGIEGFKVSIEVDIRRGLRDCYLVGLPDGAIRESVKRVQSAIQNSGYKWPLGRITINLAPAGLRKDGTAFDLPIALGVLIASGQVRVPDEGVLSSTFFAGELSLAGDVLPVPGILPRATMARDLGARVMVVPRDNAPEAAVVSKLEVVPAFDLAGAVEWILRGVSEPLGAHPLNSEEKIDYQVDYSEVRGQAVAKRALEIAAAGGHNLLMVGPPGSGKTMLARRVVTILPTMSYEEALETTKIHSVAATLPRGSSLITRRPFRAPHFTVSPVGLSGGGAGTPRPGELSLAHNGVLFLDEFPEFPRRVLEVMRGPLEDKTVTLIRGMVSVTYPCSVMLVAAMNGCPCGHQGSAHKRCECMSHEIQRYRGRISGPLMERIDLQTTVEPVSYSDLSGSSESESSASIRERIKKARQRQRLRFRELTIHCNAEMEPPHLSAWCTPDKRGDALLERCIDVFGMSARSYSRILKVARTIADLEGVDEIAHQHVAEAVAFRRPEQAGSVSLGVSGARVRI